MIWGTKLVENQQNSKKFSIKDIKIQLLRDNMPWTKDKEISNIIVHVHQFLEYDVDPLFNASIYQTELFNCITINNIDIGNG